MTLDWKFYVSTAIAVAGIILSGWAFFSNKESHSLSARVIYTLSLKPRVATSIHDLKMIIGEEEISSPMITSFSLSNDGSSPIPSSAFEAPIEISVGESARVVRATLDSVNPENLKANVEVRQGKIFVDPLLLNPGDTLKISAITDGEIPSLSFGSRIASISKISIENGRETSNVWPYLLIQCLVSYASMLILMLAADQIFSKQSIQFKWPLSVAMIIAAGFSAGYTINNLMEHFGEESILGNYWVISISLATIATMTKARLVIKRSEEDSAAG